MKIVYQSALMCCLILRAISEDRQCSDSGPSFDDCETNCSQWVKRVPGEPEYLFNCSIGRKADVERFQGMFPNAFKKDALKSFESPKLLTVNGFYKDYQDQELRSLAIDFQLPKGIKTATGEFELPKAVLLQFRSIADPEVQDNFYYQCERQRLFSFTEYSVPVYSTYDVVMPRNLSFNCFIGLDNSRMSKKPRRVYLITLTTAFGTSTTYMVTTYAFSELTRTVWYPAIATHLNETQGTIYVVFEEAPVTIGVESYEIRLLKNASGGNDVIETRTVTEPKPMVFENLRKGKYFIQVIPNCSRPETCRQAQSYIIDGHALPSQDYRIHYLDAMPDLKMVAMVLGCILATMLILLLVVCWWKKKRKGSEELGTEKWGWIVHPYESCSKEEECVVKLGRYLEDVCHCKLHPLTLPETHYSTQEYCQDILKHSSFLLVVLDNSGDEPSLECTADNFYGFTISEGSSVRRTNNNLHIIPIMFPFCNSQSKKPDLLGEVKSYQLLGEMDKVYCKIQGISEANRTNQQVLKRTEPTYVSLENVIQDLSRNNLTINPSPEDPLLPGELTKPSTPKNKQEALDIIMRLNCSDEDLTADYNDEQRQSGRGSGARPKEITNIPAQHLLDQHRPVSKPIHNQPNGKTSEYGFSERIYSEQPYHPHYPSHHFHNNCYNKQMSYPMDSHYPRHMQCRQDHAMKECVDSNHFNSPPMDVEHGSEYWAPGNDDSHYQENYYQFTSVPDTVECHAHPGHYQQMYKDHFDCSNNTQIPGTDSVSFNFHKHRLGNEMMQKHPLLQNDQDDSIGRVFTLNYGDEDVRSNLVADSRKDLLQGKERLAERDTRHHANDYEESQRSRMLQDSGHSYSVGVPTTGSLPDEMLMHSLGDENCRQLFVPPDDEEADTFLSSQEQLDQLESFNFKHS